jgi:hypothetical protein
MVGDSWRNAIVGAFEAELLARWVDREGRASHARRFIAARELGDAYPDLLRAGQMTELELVRSGINANLITFMPSGGRFSRHNCGRSLRMHRKRRRQLPSERWTIILILVIGLKRAVLD